MTNNLYPIEEETFNAWLAAKGNGDTIGVTNSAYHCMFATFLDETYDKEVFIIRYIDEDTAGYWTSDDIDFVGEMPEWAVQKMKIFDQMSLDQDFITKEAFLKALNGE